MREALSGVAGCLLVSVGFRSRIASKAVAFYGTDVCEMPGGLARWRIGSPPCLAGSGDAAMFDEIARCPIEREPASMPFAGVGGKHGRQPGNARQGGLPADDT